MKITLELSPKSYEKFTQLRKKVGVRKDDEVLRNALLVLDWYFKTIEDGLLIVERPTTGEESEILFVWEGKTDWK